MVRSTKPLYDNGTVIEGMELRFAEGCVVHHQASSGIETLEQLLSQDERARYLGEVAFVPHDSPIARTGLVFYNTRIDENAAHHLALGNACVFCVQGGKTMSKEALAQKGANESIVHVDFMIGGPEMDVVGRTKEGQSVPIFRKSAWL